MSDQLKDDPAAITCLRCGGAMFEAHIKEISPVRLSWGYTFSLEPIDKGLLDKRESPVVPLVCENCGYTELRATNPKAVKPYRHFGGGAK